MENVFRILSTTFPIEIHLIGQLLDQWNLKYICCPDIALSNGENRMSLSCCYLKLFAIKDCPVTFGPPCIPNSSRPIHWCKDMGLRGSSRLLQIPTSQSISPRVRSIELQRELEERYSVTSACIRKLSPLIRDAPIPIPVNSNSWNW